MNKELIGTLKYLLAVLAMVTIVAAIVSFYVASDG